MTHLIEFYKKQLQQHKTSSLSTKKSLVLFGIVRLLVFGVILFFLYQFFGNLKMMTITAVSGSIIFVYLVKKHSILKAKNLKLKALIDINTTEIFVLQNNALHLNEGAEYLNSNHQFSYDIDLFGKGSFFQYINRTTTQAGKNKLAETLTANHIKNIISKQKTIDELSEMPKWRQEFSATAKLVHIETHAKDIMSWMQNYQPVIPKIMAYLPFIFILGSAGVFTLFFLDFIRPTHLVLWIILGLGISGKYFKKVSVLAHKANQAKDTFKQYYQLLQQIESTSFSTKNLLKKQQQIQHDKQAASEIFQSFSKILDALDQRNNLLFGFIANAFALWDLKYSYQTEQWIQSNKELVKKSFDVIAYFDAQNSLANYRFNHPKHTFPIIQEGKETIISEQLGHPLLTASKRIDNDFSINNEAFYIITGANMAGKSTFLRAVSLSIVMANCGLPVCAKSYTYTPIKLITSMRTADSLSNDESYFFSELKRLKYIIDAIAIEKHFIVLDEILKGTNSTDKAIGSRKFVQKLVHSQSTGIIATHDLSLCEITTELPQVANYYFDAEIVADELYFDYSLKEGICQNMNASFLLTKMNIV